MGNVLPNGVWLQSMSVSGNDIKISGTGFTKWRMLSTMKES